MPLMVAWIGSFFVLAGLCFLGKSEGWWHLHNGDIGPAVVIALGLALLTAPTGPTRRTVVVRLGRALTPGPKALPQPGGRSAP